MTKEQKKSKQEYMRKWRAKRKEGKVKAPSSLNQAQASVNTCSTDPTKQTYGPVTITVMSRKYEILHHLSETVRILATQLATAPFQGIEIKNCTINATSNQNGIQFNSKEL